MPSIETYSRRRVLLLLLNAIAFCVWQVTQLSPVADAFRTAPLAYVAPVSILVWFGTLLGLVVKPAARRMRDQLEDELTQHNRRTAFTWAYWAVMLATAAGLVLASQRAVPAIDIVRAILMIGVATPLVRFALMESADARQV